MATKLYNSHIEILLDKSNSGYILDTYIALVHISSEVNSKYIIQTYGDSKSHIVKLVNKYVSASPKTIYNCIKELLKLNILAYDEVLTTWTLVNMENMTKCKESKNQDTLMRNSGYIHIRKFFFTEDFSKMKGREKRLIIYMCQLWDSKASIFHNDFSMNLLKPNSPWLKVLKTSCKYYGKYTIEQMLSKYSHLFVRKSKDLVSDLGCKKSRAFKFNFNCEAIETIDKDTDNVELVKLHNQNEYLLVKEKIRFLDITLTKQKIMHLVRAISNIKEWFIKERVVQLILNKYRAIQIYKSREDIKSISAYAAAVVRSVVLEYREFKNNMRCNKLTNDEIGEYFIENQYTNSSELINDKIKFSLSLIN